MRPFGVEMKKENSNALKAALRSLSPALLVLALSLPAGAQSSGASSDSNNSASTQSSNSDSPSQPAADPTGAGNIWSTPRYAVKEIKPQGKGGQQPSQGQQSSPSQGQGQSQSSGAAGELAPETRASGIIRLKPRQAEDKSAGSSSAAAATEKSTTPAFDDKAFREFVGSLKEPQYVWLSPDHASAAVDPKNAFKQTKTLANADQLGRMDNYIKELTGKVQSYLSVPSTATLVESNQKYIYLITFTLRERGQMANFRVEPQLGPFSTVPLADDNESNAVVGAINKALTKASPMPTPPVGFAPWYMVLKYEVNSGKVMLACLNAK